MAQYEALPKPVARRSGCKVGWWYYATETEARAAAVIAEANGDWGASQGYDFGFCSPGTVKRVTETDSEHNGLWEVCTF
jgi:hypothetical protein